MLPNPRCCGAHVLTVPGLGGMSPLLRITHRQRGQGVDLRNDAGVLGCAIRPGVGIVEQPEARSCHFGPAVEVLPKLALGRSSNEQA